MTYEDVPCFDCGLKTFDRDPTINSVHDALYIPRIPGHYDANFGIYDLYGRLVQSAGPRRGWPNKALGQSETCCISPSDRYPLAAEKTCFYGGNIVGHFGHFLTETLPRYWCYREHYRHLKVLVHAEKTLDELFSLPWLAAFFALLGLEKSDFIVFDRPTRIDTLIVAGTVFEENHFAHTALARFCNTLGAEHGQRLDGEKPVYLTRAGFRSQMRHIIGEAEVAEHLVRAGFDVISPENLSIAQQIALFSPTRPVTGFVGSSFHNSIFCASPVGLGVSCSGDYSSNFHLMDKVNQAKIRYVQAPSVVLEKFVLGEPLIYRLTNPAQVADFIIEMTRREIWHDRNDGNFKIIDNRAAYAVKTHHNTFLQIDRQTGIVSHGTGQGERILPLHAHLGPNGWAVLTSTPRDGLTVNRDPQQGDALFYHYTNQPNGTIVLRHPDTKRYLCATIDGGVICDRAETKEWEEFSLLPIQIRHSA